MSNTNVVTNLNADLLDGLHAASFYQLKPIRSDQNSIYDLRFNYGTYDKGDFNGTYKDEYPTYYGSYIALTTRDKNIGALMFFDTPTSNNLGHIYISTRGAGDSNTTYSEWGTLAYITDNVDSSSKWANARTITLTGSVTGSVSIDGSGDVSLATTTNHTHTFASLTDKPTTLKGYGIEDWVIKYADARQTLSRLMVFIECQLLALLARGIIFLMDKSSCFVVVRFLTPLPRLLCLILVRTCISAQEHSLILQTRLILGGQYLLLATATCQLYLGLVQILLRMVR